MSFYNCCCVTTCTITLSGSVNTCEGTNSSGTGVVVLNHTTGALIASTTTDPHGYFFGYTGTPGVPVDVAARNASGNAQTLYTLPSPVCGFNTVPTITLPYIGIGAAVHDQFGNGVNGVPVSFSGGGSATTGDGVLPTLPAGQSFLTGAQDATGSCLVKPIPASRALGSLTVGPIPPGYVESGATNSVTANPACDGLIANVFVNKL